MPRAEPMGAKPEDLERIGTLRGVVDVELTNRCNASCGFCPRDQTPEQGLMAPAVLERTVARVVELRTQTRELWPGLREVSFCGLGDQLIHPDVGRYVRAARDADLEVAVNTNGFLLDAARGDALLEAGVSRVFVNGGAVGAAYDDLYGLPFERVRANVERFAARAEGRCDLYIVLVDHGDLSDDVEALWRSCGVRRFFRLSLINRAGALDVEGMDYERLPQRQQALDLLAGRPQLPACRAPLQFPFIGYDGRYYLCSSDWRKEVSVGNVFDQSILEVIPQKLLHVRTGDPICRRCTHDPVNRLAAALAARDAGQLADHEVDDLLTTLDVEADDLARIVGGVEALLRDQALPVEATRPVPAPARRRIPVQAL